MPLRSRFDVGLPSWWPTRRMGPAAALVAALALIVAGALPALSTEPPEGTPALVVPLVTDVPPEPDPPPVADLPVFAEARGLPLTVISDEAVVAGYHQAGRTTRAVPLTPVHPPLGSGTDLTSLEMPTRRRGTASTGAVDLALPALTPVHSPVTGRILSVENYKLYGRTPDIRVTIKPAARAHAEVIMLHIADVRVRAGDHVVAGETVVAGTARKLPFRSQVERFSGTMPHVHVHVQPSGTIPRGD